jgi:hypothetical protein
MSITKDTPVKDLSFPQSWRLVKACEQWNRAVDKKERIETVEDLIKHQDGIIDLFGVGKKTFNYLFEALNGTE